MPVRYTRYGGGPRARTIGELERAASGAAGGYAAVTGVLEGLSIQSAGIDVVSPVTLAAMEREIASWPSMVPPYRNVRDFARSAHTRWRQRKNVWRENEAVARANAFADRLERQLDTELVRVWNSQRFDAVAQRFLAIGIGLVGAGAALGSVVPGIGTVIGAVVGAVAAFFASILPFESWALYDRFRAVLRGLTVAQRFLLWRGFRTYANTWARRERKDNPPAWQLGGSYEVARGRWEAMPSELWHLQNILWEFDSVPQDSIVEPYGLACAVANADSTHRVHESTAYHHITAELRGAVWLHDTLRYNRDVPVVEVRAAAVAAGYSDITETPISPEVRRLLLAADAGLRP